MPKTTQLTIREQAAIKLLIIGEITSPQQLYRIAYADSLEAVEALADLPANASRWLRSQRVQNYLEAEKAAYNAKREKDRLKIEADALAKYGKESSQTSTTHPDFTDYSSPAAQIAKLNELVNTAKDPGEVLDALKVLISKQNELQAGMQETKDRKVQRFYTPLQCRDCPLYKAKAEEIKQRK